MSFKAGYYYKFINTEKNRERVFWNSSGEMNFLKDGNFHKCRKGGTGYASFYDSPDPHRTWALDKNLFIERKTVGLKSAYLERFGKL